MAEQVGGELAPQEFGHELVPRGRGHAGRVENSAADLVRRYLAEMQVRGQAGYAVDVRPVARDGVVLEMGCDERGKPFMRAVFARLPGHIAAAGPGFGLRFCRAREPGRVDKQLRWAGQRRSRRSLLQDVARERGEYAIGGAVRLADFGRVMQPRAVAGVHADASGLQFGLDVPICCDPVGFDAAVPEHAAGARGTHQPGNDLARIAGEDLQRTVQRFIETGQAVLEPPAAGCARLPVAGCFVVYEHRNDPRAAAGCRMQHRVIGEPQVLAEPGNDNPVVDHAA